MQGFAGRTGDAADFETRFPGETVFASANARLTSVSDFDFSHLQTSPDILDQPVADPGYTTVEAQGCRPAMHPNAAEALATAPTYPGAEGPRFHASRSPSLSLNNGPMH